jgi:hypothetical protein
MARNLHHSCHKENAMSLSQQKLGFHYYPDTDHYGDSDLNAWLPVLNSAGAHWLTLQGQGSSTIPESFLNSLVASEIKPIVHIHEPFGSLRVAQVYAQLKTYADQGVRFVIFYDRPNLRGSWPISTWSHEALVGRFIDKLLPILEAQIEMGLTPIFPPLEPGGDYWDTAFLENGLALLQKKASDEVKASLTLAIYMWSFGKPLDWGQGGKTRWPDARPYASPDGCQDQRGFQINDWYQEIAMKVTGSKLPVIVVAGGAGPSKVYKTSDAIQIDNNEVARHLALNDLADEIQNFNFYPLATAEDHADAGAAWYIRPDVEQDESKHGIVKTPKPSKKDIEHYVLLGLSNQTNASELWSAIAPMVLSARATVGFSIDEAKRAARVSIVSDRRTIPTAYEQELTASGSEVKRYENWDSYEFLLAASSWAAKKTATGVDHD